MVTSAPKRHRWAPTSGEDVATNAQERVLAEESRAGAAAGDTAASPDDTLPPPPPKAPIRGLYVLTPDTDDDEWLAAAVAAAIAGGASAVQYRNKTADAESRLRQARMLVRVCHARAVPLIVNDSVDMAIATGAAGVHLGRDDDDPFVARRRLGPDAIIGVSCYDEFERAERYAEVADNLAFGSLFGSSTKPGAVRAPLELLTRAKARGWNVVGIGGVDASNARRAIEAGADAVAVISGVFGVLGGDAPTVKQASQRIGDLFGQ
jgi:thiamine-phosphate pyrophosphorylase